MLLIILQQSTEGIPVEDTELVKDETKEGLAEGNAEMMKGGAREAMTEEGCM